MRVLVVSQDAKERARATSALRLRQEVDVVESTTVADARARVAAEDHDVLVIDGDMSPDGGFSLLYDIRAEGALRDEPTPPALVMLGREQDRWLGAWAGANAVMIKPVDPFRLADEVAALVGQEATPPGARESGHQIDDILGAGGRNPGLSPRTG